MGQALPKRRTVLIVEDDADLRHLTATLLEDEQLDIIECESAEAALAVMLMRGREVVMIFADVWLGGLIAEASATSPNAGGPRGRESVFAEDARPRPGANEGHTRGRRG
jgi:hypothetical protein